MVSSAWCINLINTGWDGFWLHRWSGWLPPIWRSRSTSVPGTNQMAISPMICLWIKWAGQWTSTNESILVPSECSFLTMLPLIARSRTIVSIQTGAARHGVVEEMDTHVSRFHCELNPIQRCWCHAKKYTRAQTAENHSRRTSIWVRTWSVASFSPVRELMRTQHTGQDSSDTPANRL